MPSKIVAASEPLQASPSQQNGEPPSARKRRTGPPAHPIVEFPAPLWEAWDDPSDFAGALDLHMRRHGDTAYRLHKAIITPRSKLDMTTLREWRRGTKVPRTTASLAILARIARRYRLADDYFRNKLPNPSRACTGHSLPGVSGAERRRLAWHLPDDFNQRSRAEREEILAWVREVVISGATDYRRFQAEALKHRYAIRFTGVAADYAPDARDCDPDEFDTVDAAPDDPDLRRGAMRAPPRLDREMSELLRFKTSTLTDIGFQRQGVWNGAGAAQRVEHLGLLFGALAASATGPIKGHSVPERQLCFGLLVFPAIWDWYVQWRERRRGFYTQWEVDMLAVAAALTRRETGWLRQSPRLARPLQPVAGLVSGAEVAEVLADWDAACERLHRHAITRAKEIARVSRVHRDPFEPILPILESDSPLAEYRKITEEILRRRPDSKRYPLAAAEAARSFLLLRMGLHLGVRQKNLRQLLVCGRGNPPTPERNLESLMRGELRWSERDRGWEVLIPASAFKNRGSSYFSGRPYRLVLPDLGDLYSHIDSYLRDHRPRLLNGAADPRTFFIKTVKANSRDAAYDQNTFYEAWRLTIQRYGVYNPYTGHGAIRGLLPHGPHNVRDVLATHILKQTGSYEQASYAIQDTPETVARHYGRFLPQDKAVLAAQVLNKVWD